MKTSALNGQSHLAHRPPSGQVSRSPARMRLRGGVFDPDSKPPRQPHLHQTHRPSDPALRIVRCKLGLNLHLGQTSRPRLGGRPLKQRNQRIVGTRSNQTINEATDRFAPPRVRQGSRSRRLDWDLNCQYLIYGRTAAMSPSVANPRRASISQFNGSRAQPPGSALKWLPGATAPANSHQ